jgi:deoxycytidylate deaminase
MSINLAKAYCEAVNSPDESSQNGAIIRNYIQTVSYGYNGPSAGTAVIQSRPAKYKVFEHAERAAIYNAHASVEDMIMYCPWAACCDCARAIIFSGIKVLVVHRERMLLTPDHWKEDVAFALNMLQENDVEVLYHDGPVIGAPSILVNGVLWNPETLLFEDL